MQPRLVHIPRHLLHIDLDDLPRLGLGRSARATVRALIADLPAVPDAALSAQLIGPAHSTLPCLAVVARHVVQRLRDHNLAIANDRQRLTRERLKIVFLDAAQLESALAADDPRIRTEAALFLAGVRGNAEELALLASRQAKGLVSFVTATEPLAALASWRLLELGAGTHAESDDQRQRGDR